jgi:hypothetical protein
MTTLALELNDAGLLARADSGPTAEAPISSPGFALVGGEGIRTGQEAVDRARLEPRRVHTHFWSRVDAGPLGRPFDPTLSHADLAYEHLARVWSRVAPGVDRVVLVVPSAYSEHQLGLILGIAETAGVPVRGLVDAAVAAAATIDRGGPLIHVDLRLHDTVLTELGREDELVRGSVRVGEQVGLLAMRDRWAKHVAGLLVRRTRFDPLHAAATEQALYGELGPLLDRLREEDRSVIELAVGDRVHGVEVTREELAGTVAGLRDGLVELLRRMRTVGQATTVLLSRRAAGVPGLADDVASIAETEVVELPADAAVAGALRYRDAICAPGDERPWIVRLAVERAVPRPSARPAGEGTSGSSKEPPTHLLFEGRAYPIGEVPLWIGTGVAEPPQALRLRGAVKGISRRHCTVVRVGRAARVEDHSTYGTFLNGRRIAGDAPLVVGDRLQVGTPGVVLELIRVIDREASPSD